VGKGMKKITEIKPEVVAKKFSEILKDWLTQKQMAEVVKRNKAEVNEQVCHSHDFCDPNMAMWEAVESEFGKLNVLNEDALELMNRSWDIAKANNFWIPTNITEVKP
jgi:hypothetical protein